MSTSFLCLFAAVLSPLSTYATRTADPLLNPALRSTFELMITKEEIAEKVKEAALKIDAELAGEELMLIMVLKGGLLIASDLFRNLESPCTLDYVKTSSYGAGGTHRGALTIDGLDRIDVAGKNVLVVDDIFDTGATLSGVVEQIAALNPKTIRSLVLLTKNVPHETDYRPDYSLFEIENRFVIGFGLDYKEYWRNLPGVFAIQ